MGLRGIVAGKTGNDGRLSRCLVYRLYAGCRRGVWVGFDDEEALHLTGAQAALPMWVEFMRRIMPANAHDFVQPPAVVTREIDPQSLQLATSKCPQRVAEAFYRRHRAVGLLRSAWQRVLGAGETQFWFS